MPQSNVKFIIINMNNSNIKKINIINMAKTFIINTNTFNILLIIDDIIFFLLNAHIYIKLCFQIIY